ncbi:hypothetical protein HYT23_04815 [Candidatus Pacearchaeota archaeon]|nr:hypothetical protein [Candidatus Pacearchaeota archaeon]
MTEKLKGEYRRLSIILIVSALFFALFGLVLAVGPTWLGDDVNYTLNEDTPYYHNLSRNITGDLTGITFAIDTQININWTNSSGIYSVDAGNVSRWIRIENSTTGNLTINATFDNQTGFFVIPLQATNASGFSGAYFEFMVNATNDAPNFTFVNSTYNLTMNQNFYKVLNASDEEDHTPLIINITSNGTCTHASWSGRNANENCSLIALGMTYDRSSNYSFFMNFTPVKNDVGTYWFNLSVMDAGVNYACPHSFCVNSTYKANKTTAYSSVVLFSVLASLEVNTSNCDNKIFQESAQNWCLINVSTQGTSDELNISSYAILRNYAAGQSGVVNRSWFFANQSTPVTNFFKQFNVTINASKTEIGNWTINFTVHDFTYAENYTAQINVFVNRSSSLNDGPDLIKPSNLNTSINLMNTINLSVYDDDLLIPDKEASLGGFNETTAFTRTVYNLSSLASTNLSNFTISIVSMPVSGTNRTYAQLIFTANSSEPGSYIINITATDVNGAVDFETFNLTIINNNAPSWNATVDTTLIYYEGNNTYLNFSQNVTDPEGDALTFSFTNDTAFPSFSLGSSTGVVNFTSNDTDVGHHIVNITVSDGFLTDVESFNFTIWNINDSLSIESISSVNATPATLPSAGTLNTSEDNYTTLTLFIQDDDLRIPSAQITKGHYNETFSLNTTIQGINTSIVNFTLSDRVFINNRSRYVATFTPRKADVGNYNITINVTDLSGNAGLFTFNMTVISTEHDPTLSALSNQSSAVNRTLTYNLNVTDLENGNDTTSVVNTNFTFNYTILSDGRADLTLNTTQFNLTTGIINLTFNNSQHGKYHINFSVNDTTNRYDFQDIWFFVYGLPNITSPIAGAIFNLTENVTSILNFTANHSVGDNLTYLFYVDSISSNGSYTYSQLFLNTSFSYYGNGSTYNWNFTPNFSDESYSKLKNLTIIVYPNSSSLDNASLLNNSFNFKLNISHTNYPISFTSSIGDKGPTSYGTDITVNLRNHFSDLDSDDYAYNQTITFTAISNASTITKSFSGWTLTLSSTSAVAELMSINASDNSSSARSGNFTVTFTEPTGSSSTTVTSGGGGGGTKTVPVSLKIIVPDPVSAYQKDRIDLPITLHNTGQETLHVTTLSGSVAKDGALSEDIKVTFSNDSFPILNSGDKVNLTMTLIINTDEVGLFEITIDANVRNPEYHDWAKLYLTIKEGESVREKILFTEEFIVDNPECAELTELVEEAKVLLSSGDAKSAVEKAEEALAACREILAQAQNPGIRQIIENKLYRYLAIASVAAFAGGIAYYSYKRMKLRRTRGSYVQEDIKNRKYLD